MTTSDVEGGRVRRIVGPLENTLVKPGQGVALVAADGKPACSVHGAMNKVSGERDWWRCLMCNIGVECEPAPSSVPEIKEEGEAWSEPTESDRWEQLMQGFCEHHEGKHDDPWGADPYDCSMCHLLVSLYRDAVAAAALAAPSTNREGDQVAARKAALEARFYEMIVAASAVEYCATHRLPMGGANENIAQHCDDLIVAAIAYGEARAREEAANA